MSADSAVETWSRYVAAAKRDADQLADGVRALPAEGGRDALAGLAALAFRLGLSSVLVGAEDVGRLALGVERACDAARTASSPAAEVRALLEAPASALAAALAQLAAPDKSGARVEGLPLAQLLRSLEEGRSPAAIAAPPISPPQDSSPPASARAASAPPVAPDDARAMVFHWAPPVDDDMIELFFEEAQERVEGIAGKLLSIEERPDDLELLRDLFRDLHTVKGSSAMVGLAPVNELAHAAEDLVGQLREGARRADAPVVNALLAALDGLRALLATARDRKPLPASAPRVVRALRDPYAAASPAADAPAPASATSASAAQAAAHEAAPAAGAKAAATAAPAAKQTIRVDFDKLDRLLNLVGELVLGRRACVAPAPRGRR
ncbi:MAG: Hpt domain-containing protein [Polyangiaceae bacterium]|nr:Hpt domain-containing protein [Polyangiaceae bacterium]